MLNLKEAMFVCQAMVAWLVTRIHNKGRCLASPYNRPTRQGGYANPLVYWVRPHSTEYRLRKTLGIPRCSLITCVMHPQAIAPSDSLILDPIPCMPRRPHVSPIDGNSGRRSRFPVLTLMPIAPSSCCPAPSLGDQSRTDCRIMQCSPW